MSSVTIVELAEAIRDIRVANYPGLLRGTGGPTQHTKGASTEVTTADEQYAKALLLNVGLKRKRKREEDGN